MDSPYALGERIERVIENQVLRRPHATALQQGDREMTYQSLWHQASAAGKALADAGVAHGDIVAVHLERTPERVAVFLGVLLAGAAYLPLDPRWPRERVDDVVTRSGVSLVVTDDDRRFTRLRLTCLGPDVLSGPPGPPSAGLSDGTVAACVFYTSGSTGRPKGVLSPHRGACRLLVNCPTIPLDPTTVLLQAAPVPWDMHSFELWGALLNGGRCVLMDRDQIALDAEALRAAIGRGVNTLWLTSSLCNVFADECPEVFRDVRLLAIGGERASAPHLRRILDAAPELQLVNTYGPAECSMAATSHIVRRADVTGGSNEVPIGRPLPRTEVMLLDGSGEIALAGDGLALGYLNDPEETARRFFHRGQTRYYRTGDIGELDPDGRLRYRGRLDRQFKIRGVRVEPGEVEAVLRSFPSIASCSVLLVPRRSDGTEVACAYTSVDGRPLDVTRLRAYASRHLLDPMIPTRFLQVDRMPLTANGKVDFAELRRLSDTGSPAVDGPGPADSLLAEVRGLLGLPGLAMDDDLLEGGASSLEAIRLAARLTTRRGARCTVADVYRGRSLRGILDALDGRAEPATSPVLAQKLSDPVPLSHAQQRFWLAEQTAPGEADNMLVLAYLLTGPLRTTVLKQALRDVVARNPVLRTVCAWEDDAPVQRVLPIDASGFVVEEVPVREPAGTLQAIAEHATADWWSRPFSLEDEIPFRARLCRIDDQRHLLCFHIHHAAFDGWSESVLMAELATAYGARLDGRDGPPPNPIDYRQYAVWERENLQRWRRADVSFWRQALTGTPEPLLPRPAGRGEAPRRESELIVPASTVAALRRAAATQGGPPVAALLAATARALATVFKVGDLCLGTVTAGRFDAALEQTLGYFVNPLPVLVRGAVENPPAALLNQVVDRTVAALAHARTPFDELVRELRPDRSRHPWFQVWSVLQAESRPIQMSGPITAERVRVRPPTTAIELMFEAFPQPDGSWLLVVLRRADGIADDTASTLLIEMGAALELLAAAAPGSVLT